MIAMLNTKAQADDKFTFKQVTNDDLPLLHKWFQEPQVNRWWPVLKEGELIENFLERIRSKETFGYVVLLNGVPIGYIQYYKIDRSMPKAGAWLPELPKATLGTDQFIGDTQYIGKGYGTIFIKDFITYLHTIEPDITTIIVDPDPENLAAIRCYEKVGFKKMIIFEKSGARHWLMIYQIEHLIAS